MQHNKSLINWLEMAKQRIHFQGLPARICWVGLGDRERLGLAFNDMVKRGDRLCEGHVDLKELFATTADLNVVARYIAEDKMAPEEAADKWISENPDKVNAWLPS